MIELVNISSEIEFNEERHVYTRVSDGRILSGVTTMMRQMGLSPDYSGVSENILEASADRGHSIHKDCQMVDSLDLPCGNPEADWYLNMRKSKGYNAIANEYLISDKTHLASMVDAVLATKEMEENNEVILVDFKTTSSIHHESLSWQLSIYKYLFEMQNPEIKVVGVYGVWLPKPQYGSCKMFEEQQVDTIEVTRLLSCFAVGSEYLPVPKDSGSKVLAVLQDKLIDTITLIDRMKKVEEELKSRLLEAMTDANVKKWENDRICVTRVLGGTSTRFDSTTFKKEHLDIYNQYLKETETKDSIRIKIK